MKKWLIGSIITVLIGSVPSGTYASNNISGQLLDSDRIIQQSYQDRDRDRDGRDRKKRSDDDEWERRERERRERERKEQEEKERERRERERREQELKEREQRELERREEKLKEHELRELERREKEWREREWNEWVRRNRRINNLRERERWEREQRARERNDALYVIRRTAPVITLAQRNARISYTGLALVIAHQRRAQDLYRAGFYREAIFHSLRARRLALTIIARNNSRWQGVVIDSREESYHRHAPRDNDIDLRIDKSLIVNDREAVKIIINIDIN